jgi:uncharacterized membrane protein
MENNLRRILSLQKQATNSLEREIESLENLGLDTLVQNNYQLAARVRELTAEVELLKKASVSPVQFAREPEPQPAERPPIPPPLVIPPPPPVPPPAIPPVPSPLPPAPPPVPKTGWEKRIGLNLLNKIGILFVIFGVIATAAHPELDRGLRGLLLFALGGAMVGFGEFLSRKKANVFSLGMTAGGVAVTYASLVTCYFILQVLTMYPAALLCVVITAAAFFLSIRHNSQVIATFSVIGGFLPLLVISENLHAMNFSAMAYFVILGVFAFSLSFRKKWIVTAFFGLIMNLIAMTYITSFFTAASSAPHKVILILYIAVSFIIYTLIPVIGTYVEGLRFKKSDVVLIAFNTFFSTLIIYGVFGQLGLRSFDGLIAVVLMSSYILLGWFLKTRMDEEYDMKMLFFITASTFFALIIPLHFGVVWLTLGWLIQGVALGVYGIFKDKQRFLTSGIVISALCLFSFFTFDILAQRGEHFELKYFAVTLGALSLIASFIWKKRSSVQINVLKYCGIINCWFFLMYITGRMFDEFFPRLVWFDREYLILTTVIAITFIIAFAAPRIKQFTDNGVQIISRVLYVIGTFLLLVQNGTMNPVPPSAEPPVNVIILASVILIAINILSVFAIADLVRNFTKNGKIRTEWLPFLVSGYFTVILTQNLTAYYNVPFAGMTISLIYGALAVAWCAFGFWKRFVFMRRFGLGTALMAVIKVFLVDLWSLTEDYRIITFFALGVALILISFTYQYFTKRIESQDKND